jgi:hypothetical protein
MMMLCSKSCHVLNTRHIENNGIQQSKVRRGQGDFLLWSSTLAVLRLQVRVMRHGSYSMSYSSTGSYYGTWLGDGIVLGEPITKVVLLDNERAVWCEKETQNRCQRIIAD